MREGEDGGAGRRRPLRAHLGRLSDRVFYPNEKGASRFSKSRLKLSAYVFRHALVTEMREDGW